MHTNSILPRRFWARFLFWWLPFCLLLTANRAYAAPQLTLQQIFKQNAPAVVLITLVDACGTPLSLGSGFVVSPSGVIVTNHHVIEPKKPGARLVVKLPNGDLYDDVWVIHDDERRDLAVLLIKAVGLASIKLGDSDKVEVGEQVVAIGNPKGLERTFTAGIVSSVRPMPGEGYRFIQHQTPVSPGSSGGPLLNMNGEVVGINTFILFYQQGTQNLNGAVPVNYVKAYLQDPPKMTYEQYARARGITPPRAETDAPAPSLAWTNLGLTDWYVMSLAINSRGHIFAGTYKRKEGQHGLFRSTDNGRSWTRVGPAGKWGYGDLAINCTGHIFVMDGGRGLYRSTDNGATWTQLSLGERVFNFEVIAINSRGHIFVGTHGRGLYRSTDNGATWTQLGLEKELYINSLAINSRDHIFAGTDGRGLYRSTDNGATWTNLGYAELHTVYEFAINSRGHIFARSINGLYRSTDNGTTWNQLGLEKRNIWSLAINSAGHIFAGTRSDGLFRSTDNGATWTKIGLMKYAVTEITFNPSGHIFAGTRELGLFRSVVSTTSGK